MFNHQRAGIQVGQIELKLFGPVGRIERRCRHATSGSDEAGGHFRAVGQHDGKSVVAANTHAIEGGQSAVYQGAQFTVGEVGAARGAQGCLIRGAALKQAAKTCFHGRSAISVDVQSTVLRGHEVV